MKQQFLDVVLIRKDTKEIPRQLPDGFEELAAFNLLTFKSHHEPLNVWALQELVGHYVNYRKQSSPSMEELLPQSEYGLFAVCARFPENLQRLGLLTRIRPGVFEVEVLTLRIRIIVASGLPEEEQNAMLLLFSAQEQRLSYGSTHYHQKSSQISSLLFQLFKVLEKDPTMSEILKAIERETMDEVLKKTPPLKRLEGLSPEQRLEGLSAMERLRGLSAEEIAQALSPETLEAIQKLKQNGSSKAH